MFGRVTRKKVCRGDAPRVRAASSWSLPCICMTGMSSLATKGKVTNMVTSTMPGTAKITFTPWAPSHGPSRLSAPKSSTKIMPEMTGDTANGMSMNETSSRLPGKSQRVMAMAAAMPNSVLRGTEMATAISVRRMAFAVSESEMASQ